MQSTLVFYVPNILNTLFPFVTKVRNILNHSSPQLKFHNYPDLRSVDSEIIFKSFTSLVLRKEITYSKLNNHTINTI